MAQLQLGQGVCDLALRQAKEDGTPVNYTLWNQQIANGWGAILGRKIPGKSLEGMHHYAKVFNTWFSSPYWAEFLGLGTRALRNQN